MKWVQGWLEWMGIFQKNAKLIFLGLENAGKSSLLHVLKYDRYTQTDSTIHPHSEELVIGNTRFNTFDLGGHPIARKIWKDYCGEVDGVIYMVDCAD